MDIQYQTYQNFRFRFSDQGVGQPLIFVGGAFQSIDKLGPLAEHWKNHYRLVLIELPGFGESDYLPPEYSFDFTAECIASVVDELGLVNPIVAGTSYGSPSVYRYVGMHQSNVKAMVLIGSCAAVDKFMEYQVRMMMWVVNSQRSTDFPRVFTEVMCNTKVASIPNADRIHHIVIRSLKRLGAEAMKKFFANSMRLINANIPKYKIAVPTLVFTGEHDQFTRADLMSEYSKYCWDLRIVRIPDADHMCHLEQTEATLSLIDKFADSLEDQGWKIAV